MTYNWDWSVGGRVVVVAWRRGGAVPEESIGLEAGTASCERGEVFELALCAAARFNGLMHRSSESELDEEGSFLRPNILATEGCALASGRRLLW